ncbi:carbohydrate kinase family protein [Acidisoma sp. 7E03]
MPQYDVSVSGLYILDVLGVPVQEIPPGGQVTFIEEIRLTVAGTAGGTAVPCARMGLKTLAVGAVGADEKADWLLDALAKAQIDTSVMQRVENCLTASTILAIRPDGSRPALHVRGASDHFVISPEMQARALDARIVHFGGTGLLAQMDGTPTAAFLKAAKAAGRRTTFDLIAAQPETLSLVEPLMPHVDVFMPSIDEASVMAGTEDPAACARFFIDKGAEVCAISLGAQGSWVAARDGRAFHMPAFEVAVRDTTGCGDAYSAGFIMGLVKGWELEACARFATATAALVATGLGSGANVHSFAQTVQAMNSLTPRSG